MKKHSLIFISLTLSLGLGLLTGCSEFNPTDSSTSSATQEEMTLPPMNLSQYEYPEAASLPPPGYQFIELEEGTSVETDYLFSFSYIYKPYGGSCWLQGSNVVIGPNGVPYSTWISMSKPNPTYLWVDYNPHGLVFNGAQNARLSYANCNLPPGVTPANLTIWYWNEELNVYEYIGGTNNTQQQYINFTINHFSRYVVAAGG